MRILSLFIAGILIIGAALVYQHTSPDQKESPSSNDKQTQLSNRGSSRQSPSPGKSLRFLKSIPNMDINNPLPFSEIQKRTRELSLQEIKDLLAKHPDHRGATGWLRSALWAELGHRNHRESFEELLANLDGKEPGDGSFANDQAAFAFLRGRAETLASINEANSIFEDINTLASVTKSRHWQSRTISQLFKNLTNLDPQAAWELTQNIPLSETEHAGYVGLIDTSQSSALSGFFQALTSENLVRQYLAEWQPQLETPEAIQAYQNYHSQLNSRMSGFIRIPPTETIISHALSSLARFNLKAANNWLAEHQVNPRKPDYNRSHSVWRQLATHHPEEALQLFSLPENADLRRSNIGWLVEYDYTLLPQIITDTTNSNHQSQIIQSALSSPASDHVKDFFPTPEGPNRLPNFRQRHDLILEAINQGSFHERQRQIHLNSLNREFGNILTPNSEAE